MESPRTFTGKTVDEATEDALAALGVDLEDVEIRVISPGRSGILGFGGEPARIEIELVGRAASAPDDDEREEPAEEEEGDSESEPETSAAAEAAAATAGGRCRARSGGCGRSACRPAW